MPINGQRRARSDKQTALCSATARSMVLYLGSYKKNRIKKLHSESRAKKRVCVAIKFVWNRIMMKESV